VLYARQFAVHIGGKKMADFAAVHAQTPVSYPTMDKGGNCLRLPESVDTVFPKVGMQRGLQSSAS
ncbi:MAG: hypothetical protein ABUL72_04010, partial [Armatimonadota bacterium]